MSDIQQEIIDHHQIRKVLAEYCNACDRCDEIRMAAVYAEDSWDDHGPRGGRGVDFAKVITQDMRHIDSLSHLLGQSTIKVNGDTAGVETYFFAVMRVDSSEDGPVIHQLGGRFVDELVREGTEWKISRRIALRDWSVTLPVQADYVGTQGLQPGRGTTDPCFAVLGFEHSGVPAFAADR